MEPGESWKQAALREAREETGYEAEIIDFAGCICYMAEHIPKIVLYWNMKLVGASHFRANKEVDQLIWLKIEEALAMLVYQSEKELILKIT